MSYLSVHPNLLATAATDLMEIRAAIGSANATAAAQTTNLLAGGRR